MPATATRQAPVVKCPHCAVKGRDRYIGAFVGRAQCKSCGAWVDVPLDESSPNPR